jgi:hypothetical protein
MTIKFCKDCRHYEASNYDDGRCRAMPSVITGKSFLSCYYMRFTDERCGMDAKLFTPKPAPWWAIWRRK